MRAVYHRALPSDFETVTVGTKNKYEAAIRGAIENLEQVLTAPVNTPQYARESLEEVVNELREALRSMPVHDDDPRTYYDDPADEDFLKIGGTM